MKSGTWNPGINVPLHSQEIMKGAYFAVLGQRQCSNNKYQPSHISLDNLEEFWLQQKIGEAHNNKVAYNSQPTWDSKNCTASADLIEQHLHQIQVIDGAPYAYLMCKDTQVPPLTSSSRASLNSKSFDDQTIK